MYAADGYRDLPSANALREAPEMASLHVLQDAADVARRALTAAQPRAGRSALHPPSATAALAPSLIAFIDVLDKLLDAYRRVCADELYPPSNAELPF